MNEAVLPLTLLLVSVLVRDYGFHAREVKRMPLPMAMLYYHATAKHEGMVTSWQRPAARSETLHERMAAMRRG